MIRDLQFKNITKWLKLFTHISAAVLLVTNSKVFELTYLIPLFLLTILIDYFKDYYLIPSNQPTKYIVASIALELLLIIYIGFLSKPDIVILLYYVCISSTVITYPFVYSILLAVTYIAAEFIIQAVGVGFGDQLNALVPVFLSYGVSTAFVMGMSYLVKKQIREKERLAHINTELEHAYKKLIENSAAVQKLSVEQERTRLAREIHDNLAHTLTTLIVQLEACKKLAALEPSRLPIELEKAQELSRSGFNDIKRTIKALRPQVLEDKSFFAAITSILNDAMENIKVNIRFNNLLSNDAVLTSQIEITIFRVIQECITNSIRHGQASEIDIILKQHNDKLYLSIMDNGIGCATIKKGYGIQGIRERVESLKGTVEFSTSHGEGFKTKVSIPYEVVTNEN